MKNLKKRIFSVFTATALAFTAFAGTAFAAQAPIDLDFTESEGEIFSVVECSHGSGFNASSPNLNSFTVENFPGTTNPALKFFVAGKETYQATAGHIFETKSTDQWDAGFLDYYKSSIKIPFSGVEKGDIVTFTFKLKTESDLKGLVCWSDFASVYNANDEVVIKGDRSKNTSATTGKLDQFTWIGKTEDGTEDKTVSGGGWDITTNLTLTITLDTSVNKATISYPRPQQTPSPTTLETYFSSELVGNGYILFKGKLNSWRAYTGKLNDGSLYFDDIKLDVKKDYSKLPVNLDMTDSEMIPSSIIENEANVAGFDGKPRAEFTVDADDETNNVFALNIEDYTGSATASGDTKSRTNIKIPYSGLASDENIKVSFKYKDTTGNANLYWPHFGTLKTSDNKMVVMGARYDYNPNFINISEWNEHANNICFIGYDRKDHGYNDIITAATGQKTAHRYVKDNTNWITCTMIIDRESGVASITIDNGSDSKTTDLYIINPVTESGFLQFYGGPSAVLNSGDTTVYFDDIKIEAWKPLEVESTNLTATDFDADTDIELTFSNAVDASEVRKALSIAETSGNVVDGNRISTENIDANTVLVKVEGGLKYAETAYVLTLDKFKFADTEGLKLADNYTYEFVTKLAKGVYVSSASKLSGDASTITITNPTNQVATAWVVLALYDSSNKLLGYDDYYFETIGIGADETMTLTVGEYTGTVDSAKILVWNNSTEVVPYHIPVDVTP